VTAQEDLPYLPTPHEVVEKIFKFLILKYDLHSGQHLVDLGAGDGRFIIFGAEHYGLFTTGIEINSRFIKFARKVIRKKSLGHKCQMLERDLYNFDVSTFDFIIVFLIPTSHKYFKHVINQIQSEAVIISVRWPLDSFSELWATTEQIETENDQFPVYLYRKK
jgi:tRNA A58 N-methylase Trm61